MVISFLLASSNVQTSAVYSFAEGGGGTSVYIKGAYICGTLCTLVSIDDHRAVSLVVAAASSEGAVDWDLVVVWAKAMSMGVRVREKSALECGTCLEDYSLEHYFHPFLNTQFPCPIPSHPQTLGAVP